ncbi:Cell division protein sepF [Desulfotomaculum nigrificans CO-1-SRB]|uniref:Cell division protein SepF n=1 Tax=Desulfotomaculum nigrificans (strain DSM 14880 / VKM B-2319 / CO-1-SRB) TaxID=868595 RepID=F6B9B4_DESCC|nr:cell division protein SepF [Desulfotomaculum nigrificans]AEF93690.1 Cell division protein sepF [Desulfotomaculum nigrificans CO-1-SRB]
MSHGFIDKLLNFIGFEEVEEEIAEKKPEKAPEIPSKEQNIRKSIPRPELAAVPSVRQTKIVSTQPRTFTDVQIVAEHLKGGQTVIVNLSEVHPEEAQRILDYASGVVFALNGSAKKVSSEIFLFVPSGVDIVGAGDLRAFNKVIEPAEERVNARWFKSETA